MSQSQKMVPQWQKNMSYNYRRAVSANGHPKDELLSCLQKFVRRGMFDEAAYVAIELELFSALPEAKGLVTNAVNRLRVVLGEEVGVADPRFIHAFDRFYRLFEENRAGMPNANIATRRRAWLSMIWLLTNARKSRLVSWVKNAYLTPYRSAPCVRAFMATHPDFRPSSASLSPPQCDFALQSGDDVATLQPIADALVSALERRHVADGMHALDQLILFVKRGGRAARRTVYKHTSTNPMMLLFDLLRRCGRMSSKTLSILFEYFWHFRLHPGSTWAKRSHRDWPIFVTLPLLLALHPPTAVDDVAEPVVPLTDADVARLYNRQTSLRQRPMTFPEYCIDQHTLRGKRAGRGANHFAREGALVRNEHPVFGASPLKQLYNDCKAHSALHTTTAKRVTKRSAPDFGASSLSSSSSSSSSSLLAPVVVKRQKAATKKSTLPAAALEFVETQLVDAPPSLADVLADAPIAQLITGKHKPVVYVPRDDAQFVYKGPYPWPDKAAQLANVLFRYAVMSGVWRDRVNGPFTLFKHNQSTDRHDGRHNVAVYIKMPNVAARTADCWQARLAHKETLLTGDQRHVLTKESQGLQELQIFIDHLMARIAPAPPTTAERRALVDGLLHFAFRYIIDPSVGDLTLRNVLVSFRPQPIAIGIDLDDTRGKQDVDGTLPFADVFALLGAARWGRQRVNFLRRVVFEHEPSLRHMQQRVATVLSTLDNDDDDDDDDDGPVSKLIRIHGLIGHSSAERMRVRARRLNGMLRTMLIEVVARL